MEGPILVTGAAGFIGMHVSRRLLAAGHQVVGLDNLNSYYAVTLKRDRLRELAVFPGFCFVELDLCDQVGIQSIFSEHRFQNVVHLAAQAGVRYSLENPHAYVQSNIVGFLNILEACRSHPIRHLVYASSSSVYGNNRKVPFSETDPVNEPVSLYAATKRSNELMAQSYAHLFRIPMTGLRFFTVYGPWGRPDMAPFLFTRAILDGSPIRVFNHGDLLRDFTFIDDIVDGVVSTLDRQLKSEATDHEILNIGNNKPVRLMDFIHALEMALGKVAVIEKLPMQPGDVEATFANVDRLQALTGFKPRTTLETGLRRFIEWYSRYYSVVSESAQQNSR